MVTKASFQWKGDDLHFGNRKVLRIVTDQKYIGLMYRIEFPNRTLTDMLNHTRAKDAATSLALRVVDPTAGAVQRR